MLKFDDLGRGPKVNPDGYSALLREAEITGAELTLDKDNKENSTAHGTVHLRHAGVSLVAECHFAHEAKSAESIPVAKCVLNIGAKVTRVVPKGSKTLDLSDLFSGLVQDDVKASNDPAPTVANDAVELATESDGTAVVTVNFVLATGAATTDNNATTVNLDAGDYQVHLIARIRNDEAVTNMPDTTMLEFVKHCRPLTVRW